MTLNAKPIILWDNILKSADISVSSEDPSFPVENLVDWREYLIWKAGQSGEPIIDIDCGAPKTVKAFCLYGHNLFSQGQDLALYGKSDFNQILMDNQDRYEEFGDLSVIKRAQQIIVSEGQEFNGFKLKLKLKPYGSSSDKVRVGIYQGSEPVRLEHQIKQEVENNWLSFGNDADHLGYAQAIITDRAMNRMSIILKLRPYGSPSDKVKVSLYQGTDPDDWTFITSEEITVESEDSYTVEFGNNTFYPAGSYLIVVERSSIFTRDPNNYYQVISAGSSVYEGKCWREFELVPPIFDWQEIADDLYFIFSGEYVDYLEEHELTVDVEDYYELEFSSTLEPGSYILEVSRTEELSNSNYFLIRCSSNYYPSVAQWEYTGEWNEQIGVDFYLVLSELGGDWNQILSLTHGVDFNSDEPILKVFEEVNYRYYKLEITNSGLTQIGFLFLGDYLEFPIWLGEGFDPNQEEISIESANSQEGYLIGVVENYRKRRLNLEFKFLADSWVRNYFLPFWKNHIPNPFIFAWDYLNHSEEVYLVRVVEPKLDIPYEPVYRSLRLELEGRVA